jgi:hypothetical protein
MFDNTSNKPREEGSRSNFEFKTNLKLSNKENLNYSEPKFNKGGVNINFSGQNPFLNFRETKTPQLNFKMREKEKTSPMKINFSKDFFTRDNTEILSNSGFGNNFSKTNQKLNFNFKNREEKEFLVEEEKNIFSATSVKSKYSINSFESSKNLAERENINQGPLNLNFEKYSENYENSLNSEKVENNYFINNNSENESQKKSKNNNYIIDFGFGLNNKENKKPTLSLSDSRNLMNNLSKRSKTGEEQIQNLDINNILNSFQNNLNSNNSYSQNFCQKEEFLKSESKTSQSFSNQLNQNSQNSKTNQFNEFNNPFSYSKSNISSINSPLNSDYNSIINYSFSSNTAYNNHQINIPSPNLTLSSISSFSSIPSSISGFSSVYSDCSYNNNASKTTNFASSERARSFASINQSVSNFNSVMNSAVNSGVNSVVNTQALNNLNDFSGANYFNIPECENENEESQRNSCIKGGSGSNSENNNFIQYEKNLFIPKEKNNDERYKLLKINKVLKKPEFAPNRSAKKVSDLNRFDKGEMADDRKKIKIND